MKTKKDLDRIITRMAENMRRIKQFKQTKVTQGEKARPSQKK